MQLDCMKRSGFTLIELLVVVALIAVLAGITVPVVNTVQARSKQTACASNLRQIGAAMMLFCNENEGRFPGSTHDGHKEKSWIFTLAPYLSQLDEVRICPADPLREQRLATESTSYMMNDYLVAPEWDQEGNVIGAFASRQRLQFPARTITTFIASDRKLGTSADHAHCTNWRKGWKAVLADIAPDRHRTGAQSADRTRGSANYLYADGHVENHEAKRVHELVELKRINIGKPPDDPTQETL
jgi:prepilin-type N-terminal cleavage/methylation domain-containing protein/prepilin-type processing-associated H-X9-DG protein